MNAREAASDYIGRGWAPVPVQAKSKGPRVFGWQNRNFAPADFPIGGNVGMKLGTCSGGLVDVDLDCPEAVARAHEYLPGTGAIFGRAGNPHSHRLYVVDEPQARKPFKAADGTMLVELRGNGAQTIFPPSVHPSGERVEWERDGEPARVTWAELEEACAALAAACRPDEAQANPAPPANTADANGSPPRAARPTTGDADSRLLARAIAYAERAEAPAQGSRNDAAFRLAGHLLALEGDGLRLTQDQVAEVLLERWNPRCAPPLPAAEVRACVASAARGNGTPREAKPDLPVVPWAPQGEAGADDEKKPAPSQADILVGLALEQYRIGRTPAGEPFAVERNGPNLAHMLRGSKDALRARLAREFRQRMWNTPRAAALADALCAREGEALETAPEPAALRVGRLPDDADNLSGDPSPVAIDLGEEAGRAVVVGPDGCQVREASPVLFRRSALTGPLPVPQRGGSLQSYAAS